MIKIKDIICLSSLSRLILFLIQVFLCIFTNKILHFFEFRKKKIKFLGNILIEDHKADAFDPPRVGKKHELIELFLNGFRRWDGIHFLNIATYGYIFEHSAAFFPLFPFSISLFTRLIFLSDYYYYNNESIFLLSASLLNFIYFNIANCYLFKLTLILFNDNNTFALLTSFLFALNPGNIFFSASYSESLYSMLTFSALYYLHKNQIFISYFLFFLSCLTRSNGILNSGFIIYFLIKNHFLNTKISCANLFNQFIIQFKSIRLISAIILTVLFMFSAFFSYQYYIYLKFCTFINDNQEKTSQIPIEFINYAKLNDYNILFASKSIDWCKNKVPLSYSHIQATYWNVGFLKYWKIKQIPNFLLVLPLFYVCIHGLICFFKSMDSSMLFNLFGLINNNTKIKKIKNFKNNTNLYPFAVHCIFLLISGIFFMHVQVSTRFVCSSNPFIYWYNY